MVAYLHRPCSKAVELIAYSSGRSSRGRSAWVSISILTDCPKSLYLPSLRAPRKTPEVRSCACFHGPQHPAPPTLSPVRVIMQLPTMPHLMGYQEDGVREMPRCECHGNFQLGTAVPMPRLLLNLICKMGTVQNLPPRDRVKWNESRLN